MDFFTERFLYITKRVISLRRVRCMSKRVHWFFTFFRKWRMLIRLWLPILNLRIINKTKISRRVSKKAAFWAYSKSVEKVEKMFTKNTLLPTNFLNLRKIGKTANFLQIYVDNVFRVTFHNYCEISIKSCIFWYLDWSFPKLFFGSYSISPFIKVWSQTQPRFKILLKRSFLL